MMLGYMHRAQPTTEALSGFDVQSLNQTLSGRHGGRPTKPSLAPSPSGATELIFCSSNPTTINHTVTFGGTAQGSGQRHFYKAGHSKAIEFTSQEPRARVRLLYGQGQIAYCTMKNVCVCVCVCV